MYQTYVNDRGKLELRSDLLSFMFPNIEPARIDGVKALYMPIDIEPLHLDEIVVISEGITIRMDWSLE